MISALKKGDDDQTPWTPAINLAMGWGAALEDLKEETNRSPLGPLRTDGKRRSSLVQRPWFRFACRQRPTKHNGDGRSVPEGIDDTWRSALKDNYQTQVIGAQDHLKGKMFRVGSMGITPVEEMVEGCKRMIACFRDFGSNSTTWTSNRTSGESTHETLRGPRSLPAVSPRPCLVWSKQRPSMQVAERLWWPLARLKPAGKPTTRGQPRNAKR